VVLVMEKFGNLQSPWLMEDNDLGHVSQKVFHKQYIRTSKHQMDKKIVFNQDYYYKVISCKHVSQSSFKMYIRVFFPITKFQMQFYVSFLHCVHDLRFNICVQTFCKRGCVLYFVELCPTTFLHFCIIVKIC
jgi:hypothetical protein